MKIEEEIIDYEKNIKEINHWVTLKGEYRYFSIINFLKSKSIACTWENVTYYIKYDKRILINSFKYIVFLEEVFKSFVCKNSNLPSKKILRYGFIKTMQEYLSLKDVVQYDDIDLELLSKEIDAINEYRNQVVHNKIILNEKYNGKTLEEILIILKNILPKSYRKGFITDINSCSKNLCDNLWCIKL